MKIKELCQAENGKSHFFLLTGAFKWITPSPLFLWMTPVSPGILKILWTSLWMVETSWSIDPLDGNSFLQLLKLGITSDKGSI